MEKQGAIFTAKAYSNRRAYSAEEKLSTCRRYEAERLAKSMALARRNFLMVSSKRGGEAVCVAMTLIETAVANGVEPLGYLSWVLSNRRDMERHPEHYLPWSENVPDEIMI